MRFIRSTNRGIRCLQRCLDRDAGSGVQDLRPWRIVGTIHPGFAARPGALLLNAFGVVRRRGSIIERLRRDTPAGAWLLNAFGVSINPAIRA